MAIEFKASALPADKLSAISNYAQQLVAAQNELVDAIEAAKLIEQRVKLLEEQLLPEAMADIGMKDFTLSTGEKVLVKPEYYCGISKAMEGAAFAWLRKSGNDSLIKRMISAQFGKGEDKLAAQTLQQLTKLLGKEFAIVDKASINAQTLKAFVRERVENGQELPKELFGVHIINRAKVSRPEN